MTKNVLVTGAAGFIGAALCKRLCHDGYHVFGLDNLNSYYDPQLKENRLKDIARESFQFKKIDLLDRPQLESFWEEARPDYIVHLAAQAGVRYSLENPHAYIDSNITGFLNILEMCRHKRVKHLVYASSSSVYGGNTKVPFSEDDSVEMPVSLYAATKRSNELMAYTYKYLHQVPCTGLRFFTVYGPWGRPDMAYYKFALKIMKGEVLDVYNHGQMKRDFTYIDDIIDGVVKSMTLIPSVTDLGSNPIFNLGHSKPVFLEELITGLEQRLGKKAQLNYLPHQAVEIPETYADLNFSSKHLGFQPRTALSEGLDHFIHWFLRYHSF